MPKQRAFLFASNSIAVPCRRSLFLMFFSRCSYSRFNSCTDCQVFSLFRIIFAIRSHFCVRRHMRRIGDGVVVVGGNGDGGDFCWTFCVARSTHFHILLLFLVAVTIFATANTVHTCKAYMLLPTVVTSSLLFIKRLKRPTTTLCHCFTIPMANLEPKTNMPCHNLFVSVQYVMHSIRCICRHYSGGAYKVRASSAAV